MAEPIVLYRLWCGRKRYSGWTEDKVALLRIALREGLAFESAGDIVNLGPLTWIETGTRRYRRSKTIPQPRAGR